MNSGTNKTGNRGFSLVELLVVMVIMGLVMTSVYGLYVTNQRSASTQDELVDLQQNLRIAMDWFARDIRMAGFMVPKTQFPVNVASANTMTILTASPSGRFAVVADDFTSDTSNEVDISIERGEMVAFFDTTNYNSVRIIRPPDHSQPIDAAFTVAGASGTTLTLDGFTVDNVQYVAGDVIVYSTGAHPQSVTYDAVGGILKRNGETIAEGITSLSFEYFLDSSSSASFTTVTGDTRKDIRAVSVTLTGSVDTVDGTKTRSINSVIGIRNR